MRGRRPGALTLATIGAVPILVALVVLDVIDSPVSRWFYLHSFTTSAVVSVLVLLITVLNVDRIARRRQLGERSRVIGAQAMIVGRQAQRAVDEVTAAHDDDSRRDAASDELRSFMTMLLVSAPLLIDSDAARAFLESAQRLGGQLAWIVAHADDADVPDWRPRLQTSAQAVRDAAEPLVGVLRGSDRRAVTAGSDAETALSEATASGPAR